MTCPPKKSRILCKNHKHTPLSLRAIFILKFFRYNFINMGESRLERLYSWLMHIQVTLHSLPLGYPQQRTIRSFSYFFLVTDSLIQRERRLLPISFYIFVFTKLSDLRTRSHLQGWWNYSKICSHSPTDDLKSSNSQPFSFCRGGTQFQNLAAVH